MRVTFIRHGQTYENTIGLSMGQAIDSSLDDVGKEQARQVALLTKDEKIDFIYSSDLKRCLETAQAILKFHPDIAIIKDSRLRERSHGVYGGMKRAEREKIEIDSGELFDSFCPPEGESYLDLQNRIYNFYQSLLDKHSEDNILIVSHVGLIAMLLLKISKLEITKKNYTKFKLKNGFTTTIDSTSKDNHKIIFFN